jgi:hypothetical protein
MARYSPPMTLTFCAYPSSAKADLIKNKRAVGRLQDLADVDELEKLD